MAEIARLTFSSTSTVHKYLKCYEIPIRKDPKDRIFAKGRGLAYGKRVKKRCVVDFKKEQKAIEQMRSLRDKGFSLPKIAEVLNTLGVPTKTGRAKWTAKTVQQVIDS